MDSLIGSVLGTVVPVCLLRCSMQRMIAIIRIVVMSNPTDAMRSSNIIVYVSTTLFVVRGLKLVSSMVRELWIKVKKFDYSASSRCLVRIRYV